MYDQILRSNEWNCESAVCSGESFEAISSPKPRQEAMRLIDRTYTHTCKCSHVFTST
jgi:hypothetical protein